MFNFTSPVNRDFILGKVSEEDIFERYLGIKPDLSATFCNPLRESDNSPSCGFYINKSDRLKFKDDGGGFDWDCFNVVEYLFKCSFGEALRIVAKDFGLTDGTISNPVIHRTLRAKEKVGIRIKRKDWDLYDKKYWHTRYYQTRLDLQFLRFFPVSHAWYERGGILEQFYEYSSNDPCYGYHFPEYGPYEYKLYFPFREPGNKFRQTRGDIIQGLHLLPEKGHILGITKSFKDVACIRKFQHICDLYSIAPMSETQVIPKEIMEDLMRRFDYLFTLFDLDRAGIRLARKYQNAYGIEPMFFGKQYKQTLFTKVPNSIKDFADHLDHKRYQATEQLIKTIYDQRINS
jgi:hypothetical protein